MKRRAFVHRIPAAAPNDVSGLAAAIADGLIDPHGIVAILGKTEGNGCVNDFTRAFAVQSLMLELKRHLPDAQARAVCCVMSGGTEGGLSPHWLLLERREAVGAGTSPALAMGRARSRTLLPEEIGRMEQVEAVAAAVRDAMADAGISQADEVHFVQIKCPLLTAARMGDAAARGQTTAVRDTLKSMGISRGASALGVALALGELTEDQLSDAVIGTDLSLWSDRASTSAGIELMDNEIVVLGMSPAWSGLLAVDHAVMADSIDIEPVRAAMARLGLPTAGQLSGASRERLVAVLAKAEPSTTGQLRGHRHTMLDDSDVSATRHARAFVAGALAGLVGHAEIFVSGGAEHQGPDGGGPVAVIIARELLPLARAVTL
ncbi:MAG: ring-opening amidohydrolase [Beijerinckiaceae bacterium]